MSSVSEGEYTSRVDYDRRWTELLNVQQQNVG